MPSEIRGTPRSSLHCPACRRYIGTAPVCPYCDADARGATAARWLWVGALCAIVLGLVGLALLS